MGLVCVTAISAVLGLTGCESATKPIEGLPTVSETETVVMDQPKVYFSAKSGFYDSLSVELSCPIEGAVIYYTTDGSTPSDASNKYEGAIALSDPTPGKNVYASRKDYCSDSDYVPMNPVTKANIIRAVAYFNDGTVSEVTCGTYFIGKDRAALYADAPVISLVTDADNLFDEDTGIFILGNSYKNWLAEDSANATKPSYQVFGNFSNKGKAWERPVSFEVIAADGDNYFANMGLRMKGASTRTYLQKSMKLIAREEYGTKNVKYPLIPGNTKSSGDGEVTKYKSFVLRNGGNDNGWTKLRDPFLQSFMSERSMETQQSAPCVVFLNGEYWGLYTITEDYSDSYFEANYDVPKENVVVVKCGEIEEGTEEDIALYNEFYDFVVENDMTDSANYEAVKNMLDVEGFIEYCAFEFYIFNHDAFDKDNNWALWRVREADDSTPVSDGKWRMMLYDTEFSSGVYGNTQEYNEDNISSYIDPSLDSEDGFNCERPLIHVFRSLYENEEFRHDLIVTMCDERNYDFESKHAFAMLEELAAKYRPLAAESILRYGPDWVVLYNEPNAYYEEKIKELKSFIGGRYLGYMTVMKRAFDLSEAVDSVVGVNDVTLGNIRINFTDLDFEKWGKEEVDGRYFKEYTLSLEAKPKNGSKFVKWEYKGCEVSDENSPEVVLTITDKYEFSVKAVFE